MDVGPSEFQFSYSVIIFYGALVPLNILDYLMLSS